MPVGPARMPILDHFAELRDRIFRTLLVLLVAVIIFYVASPTMGQFLLLPISDFLPKDATGAAILVALDPFESFTTRFKISIWMAMIACAPFIVWQILAFLLPALKPNERKWFLPTFAAGVLLFIFGTIFCYYIALHPAFGWLSSQAAGLGEVEPRMATYIDMIIKFEIGFGLAFELPLIVFYLVVFDVMPYKKLRGAWRWVYVILIVGSAMITPDASPVTMLMLFAALVVLYEGSLLLARIVLSRKIKRQTAELELDPDEEAEELRNEMERHFGSKAERKAKKAAEAAREAEEEAAYQARKAARAAKREQRAAQKAARKAANEDNPALNSMKDLFNKKDT